MSRFRHYLPSTGRFTSMHQTFATREESDRVLAQYIERTERGIRLDSLPWIHEVITVEVEDENRNVIIL